MPGKKDNLPVSVDVDLENGGTIKYANEVIAIIAGVAASEVDGIAGMCTSGGISDILSRNRGITRGVKVEIGTEEASVELYIAVEYGSPIQKVASEVQENVRKAIETMTGLHVVSVDVHVQGVSFEREKKALQSGLESAHLSGEDTQRIEDATRETLRSEKEEAARAEAAAADDAQDQTENAPAEAQEQNTQTPEAQEQDAQTPEASTEDVQTYETDVPTPADEASAAAEPAQEESAEPPKQEKAKRTHSRKK